MTDAPDFEALRAKRNATVLKHARELMTELGAPPDEPLRLHFNPNACYCACGHGGPCEHKWDGPAWESEDGCMMSATCSRCGTTAMSHDMRTGP